MVNKRDILNTIKNCTNKPYSRMFKKKYSDSFVNRTMREFVDKGFITKRLNPEARNSVIVEVTDKGNEFLFHMSKVIELNGLSFNSSFN